MKHIIDYRNARYQGDLLDGKPHGLGIMIDFKNIFCLAEWKHGLIHGNSLVIFGDSKIFYGRIIDKHPTGICTYHLKDKCQIFCHFVQPSSLPKTSQSPNPSDTINANKLVALLPTFNLIIKVEGQNEQQLQIKSEHSYRQNDFQALHENLQKMLNLKIDKSQFESLLSIENFVRTNFVSDPKYANSLDIVMLSNQDGTKQIFLTLKTLPGHSSLGIRIQNCMQNTTTMTNLHNDGNSYIVKSIGFFAKQGLLQYGLKNIKTLIKGNVKEEAIYSNERTIVRYENEQSRPKQCSLNLLNYFKKSSKYVNEYLPVRHLSQLQAECLNINFNIKETETKKYAQLILENPKQLSMLEKQTIEDARLRKLNTPVHKNSNHDNSTNSFKKAADDYSKKNEQLQKVRDEIYRSVSKKKINGTKSTSPYSHAGINLSNSPENQLRPAQLTNVKPILDLYKKTPDKSFYNSINNSLPKENSKNIEGYKFSIQKNVDPNNESQFQRNTSKTTLKEPASSLGSTDYFKNLDSRRRLYEQAYPASREKIKNQTDSLKRPNVIDYGTIQKTPKKKISYLPQENEFQALENSRYNRNLSNPNFNYLEMSREDPRKYSHLPQQRRSPYNQEMTSRNPDNKFFRPQRLSPHENKTPEKYLYSNENQVGKLGRRTQYKKDALQRSIIDALDFPEYKHYPDQDDRYTRQNGTKSSFDPIIVPQLKINYSNSKKPVQEDDYVSANPRRQHNLRANIPSNYLGYRQAQDGNGYFVAKQQSFQNRNVSPLQKRKKILNSNPFDS